MKKRTKLGIAATCILGGYIAGGWEKGALKGEKWADRCADAGYGTLDNYEKMPCRTSNAVVFFGNIAERAKDEARQARDAFNDKPADAPKEQAAPKIKEKSNYRNLKWVMGGLGMAVFAIPVFAAGLVTYGAGIIGFSLARFVGRQWKNMCTILDYKLAKWSEKIEREAAAIREAQVSVSDNDGVVEISTLFNDGDRFGIERLGPGILDAQADDAEDSSDIEQRGMIPPHANGSNGRGPAPAIS